MEVADPLRMLKETGSTGLVTTDGEPTAVGGGTLKKGAGKRSALDSENHRVEQRPDIDAGNFIDTEAARVAEEERNSAWLNYSEFETPVRSEPSRTGSLSQEVTESKESKAALLEDYDLEEGELVAPELRTLTVDRLAPKTTNEILIAAFSSYGHVLAASVVARPRRVTVGTVEFQNPAHAARAVAAFGSSAAGTHPTLGRIEVHWADSCSLLPQVCRAEVGSRFKEQGTQTEPETPIEESPFDDACQGLVARAGATLSGRAGWASGDDLGSELHIGEDSTAGKLEKQAAACRTVLEQADPAAFLYLPSLPLTVTSQQLARLFAPHGACFVAAFPRRCGKRVFGVVAYTSEGDAWNARAALHGTDPFDDDVSAELAVESPNAYRGVRLRGLPLNVKASSVASQFDEFGLVRAVRIMFGGGGSPTRPVGRRQPEGPERRSWRRAAAEPVGTEQGECEQPAAGGSEPDATPACVPSRRSDGASATGWRSRVGDMAGGAGADPQALEVDGDTSDAVVEFEQDGCAIRALVGLVGRRMLVQTVASKWRLCEMVLELV
ncbi:hypothetical protein HK405_006134 [Cladochytrium tenue]|nr:hypothetical protein HK405_006134 [Cladochytrium tenue]